MRKLLLAGGVAALIAMPATAVAGTTEQVPDADPVADEGAAGATTSAALHAEGRGTFRFRGSGGLVISGRGVVRVRDDSAGDDLTGTPTGFGAATAADGGWRRYAGAGRLVLDGSHQTVVVAGRFRVVADATAANPVAGVARVRGRGVTTLKGGARVPFRASARILLTTAPMSVDLHGHGRARDGVRRIVRRVVVTRRVETPKGVTHRRVVRVTRRAWTPKAPGATWRLSGPASGTVTLTTLTGRLRVWDRSAGGDLAVTVPAGTSTTTLGDGSVVYSGLRGAPVTVAGTGFRMKVRAHDVEGTFTPAPASLARSFVRGAGTFSTGTVSDVHPGRRGGVRVLLQPTPAT